MPETQRNFIKEISTIIFDMDGLMLDTERLAQQAWQRAGDELGYRIPDDVYLLAVGRTAADTEREFTAALGADFPFQAMYERKQTYLYAAIDSDPIPTKQGLFPLLDRIDELALAKAVATSTARTLALKKLTMSRLLDRFPVVVGGDEVKRGKPSPDIFLATAARLGVEPAHCLVLEDSEAGIAAAHAAGMHGIMIPDLKEPSAQTLLLADRVLPSLTALIPLLDELAE